MARINFYLEKPNGDKETMLNINIYLAPKRFKLVTGEKIHPKYWNAERQEVRKSHPNSLALNELFKNQKMNIENILISAKSKSIAISSEYLKSQFYDHEKPKDTSNQFIEAFSKFVSSSIGVKSESTINAYRYTLRMLQEYADDCSFNLCFDRMTLEFYDGFLNYLIHTKGLMNNTVGNYIKHLKNFLNFAYDRDYHSNLTYKKFSVFKEDSDQIHLTQKELLAIINADLPPNSKLDNTRWLFIILCLTGLRFCDMFRINPENVRGDFLYIHIAKQRENLVIPIVPRLKSILDKLNRNEIHKIQNQKMNDYLKIVGLRAGITEATNNIKYQAGKMIETIYPKYELIGTHTGRRTFTTLSLERGMRPDIIQTITGHKDKSSFSKYIKLTETALYEEMMRVWGDF